MTSKISPWWLTALATALVVVAACQSKSDVERQREAAVAAAEREVAKPATAGLKRSAPFAPADRASWQAQLQWPAACETRFAASVSSGVAAGAAGTAGGTATGSTAGTAVDHVGLSLHPAGAGITIVGVRCSPDGELPPAHLFVRFDERGSSPVATVLKFPTPLSTDVSAEVVGEAFINADGHTLSLLAVARPSRDCGTWTRYSISGEHPRLVAAAALPCPAQPGPPVAAHDGESPAGWRPLDVGH